MRVTDEGVTADARGRPWDPGEEPVQLRVKTMEISFHGMPCQHIAETRHHDFGDKCWGISSISQIDDRGEYTTLLPFKGHVPVA